MTDITAAILPRLKEFRIPRLDLGEDFIYPNYQGSSILNLPSTICQLLGADRLQNPPLHADLLVSPTGVKRIILILVDALSLHRLQRWMSDGTSTVWSRLSELGKLSALTSVVPSTTASALTSLWTGRSPAEHGIVGYELWLKEYGVVSNMITHAPISFLNDTGSLVKAGFNPELFLNINTIGSHLASFGIRSYAFQHRNIIYSGLSHMFFKDVDPHGYISPGELWVNLRHLIESNPRQSQYFWVYTGQIDHFSHYYHPDDERTATEFGDFSQAFEHQFLDKLSPALRQGTLVLLTADHGMIATHKSSQFDLHNHPDLTRLLHILPTGESRLMYLFIRPGCTDQVRTYFNQAWPDQFSFLDPSEAVAKGLFGSGTPHPHLLDRLGDLIVLAHSNAYLWWADKENLLVGRHGGLSADEMIVPLLSAEL